MIKVHTLLLFQDVLYIVSLYFLVFPLIKRGVCSNVSSKVFGLVKRCNEFVPASHYLRRRLYESGLYLRRRLYVTEADKRLISEYNLYAPMDKF